MTCKMCKERKQTWSGDAPSCAFETDTFESDNWNCATMNALRDMAEARSSLIVYSNDQKAILLPFRYEPLFLLLSWYKSRGRTEQAWVVGDEEPTKLTLKEAISLIGHP